MTSDEILLIFLLFMINFLFIGYLNTWGIYQNYFIKELNYSAFEVSFISSLSIGLSCLCIFIKPLIFKINYLFILYIGLLLCSLSLLLSSISLNIWCLYLTLGFMYGIGYSFINFFLFILNMYTFPDEFAQQHLFCLCFFASLFPFILPPGPTTT